MENVNFYITDKQKQSFEYIKSINSDKKIITNVYIGQIMPGITGKTVFAGHLIETQNKSLKTFYVDLLYKTNNKDDEKIKFLKQYNVDYIYFSTAEKNMGDFNPDQKQYLKKVFDNQDVQIYELVIGNW